MQLGKGTLRSGSTNNELGLTSYKLPYQACSAAKGYTLQGKSVATANYVHLLAEQNYAKPPECYS